MNRRGFLAALAGAFVAPDPEKLLWTPGKKLISIPKPTIWANVLRPYDSFTIQGVYATQTITGKASSFLQVFTVVHGGEIVPSPFILSARERMCFDKSRPRLFGTNVEIDALVTLKSCDRLRGEVIERKVVASVLRKQGVLSEAAYQAAESGKRVVVWDERPAGWRIEISTDA